MTTFLFTTSSKYSRNIGALLLLLMFLGVQNLIAQTITTVSPNTGRIGQKLNLTISGTGLNFVSGSYSIQASFKRGSDSIPAPCQAVISGGAVAELYLDLSDTSYAAGLYNLELNSTDHGLLTLSNAFEIDTTRLLFTNPQKIYKPNSNVKVQIIGHKVKFNTVANNPFYFRNNDTIHTTLGATKGADTLEINVNLTSTSIREGNYDLHVLTSSGPLYLRNALEVLGTNISGKVFYDINKNGIQNTGEKDVPGVKLELLNYNKKAYSGPNGEYRFSNLDTGTYKVIRRPLSWMSTSDTQTIVVSSGNAFIANFGVYPIKEFIAIRGIVGRTRCADTARYTIRLQNFRTTSSNGVYYFVKDSLISFVGSTISSADSVKGDTAFFSYTNLDPMGAILQPVKCLFPSVSVLRVGATVRNYLHAYRVDGSGVKITNSDTSNTVKSINRCSYDPNDKQVSPPGYDSLGYIRITTPKLEYKIRFQNTGNDTAYRVQVIDTLSKDLKWSTFQFLESSHNVVTELDTLGIATFTFNNIFLVDSGTNEPASNGFLTFSIEPDSGLKDTTTIRNRAGIYFDFNPPVITNYAHSTFTVFKPIWTYSSQSICQGQVYTFPDGDTSSVATVDTSHFITRTDHDSSVVTTLSILPVHNSIKNDSICSGATYFFPDGDSSKVSTTDTSVFSNIHGCDSVIITNLIVKKADSIVSTISACDTYTWIDGKTYTSSNNSATMKFTNSKGCDSVVALNLTINPSVVTNKFDSICQGATYYFPDGDSSKVSTTDSSLFKHVNGCDSLIITQLTVHPNPTVSAGPDDTICAGDTFQLNASGGTTYSWSPSTGLLSTNVSNPKGTLTANQLYSVLGTDMNGCSASDQVNIIINNKSQVSLAALINACTSDPSFKLSGGTPAGGYYLGTGISNYSIFDPAVAGAGIHTIIYASALTGNCITRDTQNLIVLNGPQISWSTIGGTCLGDEPIELTAIPTGGTYTGNGISGGKFNPDLAGLGNHLLEYKVSGSNGCEASNIQSVGVHTPTPIDIISGRSQVAKNNVYTYSLKAINGAAYQWFISGGIILSQTSNTAMVKWGNGNSGYLSVIQTNTVGCQDSAVLKISINVLGSEEQSIQGNKISLFPNPADNEFSIDFGSLQGEVQLKMLDASLKVVKEEKLELIDGSVYSLDVSNLKNGIYYVLLSHKGEFITNSVIISR